MKDQVTWATCPTCDRVAAVGWATVLRPDRRQAQVPVDFDCPSGCRLDTAQLRHIFQTRVLAPAFV